MSKHSKIVTVFISILITVLSSEICSATQGELFEEWALDIKDSVITLENEIEIQPANYRLRFVLGTLYFELGVAKVDSNTKAIQANLLMLDKAEKEFKEVLKIKKDDSLTYYYLGLLAMQKGFDIKQAIEYFNKAIISGSKDQRAYLKLHVLYLMEKRYNDALLLLEGAKKRFDGSAEIYHRLSLTYLFVKDYEKVIENAQKALSFSKNIETQLILASAYSLTKKYDYAQKELEDILKTDPKNKSALLGLSVVLGKMGKKEKAIEILQEAQKYYPDDSEVKKQLKEINGEK